MDINNSVDAQQIAVVNSDKIDVNSTALIISSWRMKWQMFELIFLNAFCGMLRNRSTVWDMIEM